MTDYDFCIIGAGPAGSSSAYLLARAGYRVALFDRTHFPRDKTCGDGITPRGARVLQRLGVLEAVRAQAFACHGVTVRADERISFSIPFDRAQEGLSDLLVLPRFQLDAILLTHALQAHPDFFPDTKIVQVVDSEDHCSIQTEDGRSFTCAMAVLATGAESQLLRACGLLKDKPPLEHAARAYFDNVAGLTKEVVLFFDGVDQPGYGWIFPTSATSANIGCGAFKRDVMPQAERLKQLIAEHPLLQKMLANATQSAPLKAYPLRTDYQPEYAGAGRMICVGEAAGLVNPVTGEGIDYALESAEFLAQAIIASDSAGARRLEEDLHADVDVAQVMTRYRKRLAQRFQRRFALYRWLQRHALNERNSTRLLAQVQRAPALQRIVVDGLFGRGKAAALLKPKVLMQVLRVMWLR